MPGQLSFRLSGSLHFGPDSAGELAGILDGRGYRKAFLVTDRGLVKAGVLGTVEAILGPTNCAWEVYDGVESDPSIGSVVASAEAASKADCDVVIGLGGGSSLDTAKLTAVQLRNSLPLEDLIGIDNIPERGVPTVLLPTTAGTGSEVTPIAVLSDKKQRLKRGVVSDHLYATHSIVDPALTVSVPPRVTAFTGMDALTHAIEAFTNKYSHPFVDTFALEAIRRIGANLRRAVWVGDDLEARTDMALASLYGGMCLGPVNTAAVHALAYPLGGMFDVPHGVANSLLLPYVMEYNLPSSVERFAQIGEALGEKVYSIPVREAATRAVEAVRTLSADVGVVSHMRDVGVEQSALREMAQGAIKVERLLRNNPRPMSEADIYAIYEKAF